MSDVFCPCWIQPIDPDECKGSCEGAGDCIYTVDEEKWRSCEHFMTGCLRCVEIDCEKYYEPLTVLERFSQSMIDICDEPHGKLSNKMKVKGMRVAAVMFKDVIKLCKTPEGVQQIQKELDSDKKCQK